MTFLLSLLLTYRGDFFRREQLMFRFLRDLVIKLQNSSLKYLLFPSDRFNNMSFFVNFTFKFPPGSKLDDSTPLSIRLRKLLKSLVHQEWIFQYKKLSKYLSSIISILKNYSHVFWLIIKIRFRQSTPQAITISDWKWNDIRIIFQNCDSLVN